MKWFADDEDFLEDLSLSFASLKELGSLEAGLTVGKALKIGQQDIYQSWMVPPWKMDEVKEVVRQLIEVGRVTEKERKERQKKADMTRTLVSGFAGSEGAFWDLEWRV